VPVAVPLFGVCVRVYLLVAAFFRVLLSSHELRVLMSSLQGRGERQFSSPVEFPFVGSNHDARGVRALVAAAPPVSGLGKAVNGQLAGSEWSVAGGHWSDKMCRLSSSSPLSADLPPPAAPPARRRRGPGAASSKSTRPRSQGGRAGQDGAETEGGDGALFGSLDDLPPPLQARRARRVAQAPTAGQDAAVDALVPCLQRVCGLPASTSLLSRRAGVSATVVAHRSTRSRCIVLRSGSTKMDCAVLWVSARGGLLCCCFLGTQNALLLSASSRSSACKHVGLLEKAMAVAVVSAQLLVERTRLPADATELVVPQQYGSASIWVVLYRSVFSVVTFSAANVAACIAPGCRRLRGRCGHVKVARPVHQARKDAVPDDAATGFA